MSPAHRCPECEAGLEHCHDVWVLHRDGHEECILASCRFGADGHVIILACTDIDPACTA